MWGVWVCSPGGMAHPAGYSPYNLPGVGWTTAQVRGCHKATRQHRFVDVKFECMSGQKYFIFDLILQRTRECRYSDQYGDQRL